MSFNKPGTGQIARKGEAAKAKVEALAGTVQVPAVGQRECASQFGERGVLHGEIQDPRAGDDKEALGADRFDRDCGRGVGFVQDELEYLRPAHSAIPVALESGIEESESRPWRDGKQFHVRSHLGRD
jgi:hypothetical protein